MENTLNTYWVRIYLSGPIDVAKQVIHEECLREGLCVTVEPCEFIYTGGEEKGYVVGLINYPRFPVEEIVLWERAKLLAEKLRLTSHQQSYLIQSPINTYWNTTR